MNTKVGIEKLFARLHASHNDLETSNGLGLAIVKKIADVNNLRIAYDAKDGIHSFDIMKNWVGEIISRVYSFSFNTIFIASRPEALS